VESLKVWTCTGEYWSLICDYVPNAVWADGPRFSNGYHSRRLGRLVQSILMNPNLFMHGRHPNTNGTVQINVPTEQQTNDATLQISGAFGSAIIHRNRAGRISRFVPEPGFMLPKHPF